jgi:S-adenosylmethionine synthetase
MKKTAEFVSPKHPDKICDIVADTILAAYMKADPQSRVAVEVMGGHGHILRVGRGDERGARSFREGVPVGIRRDG